MEGKRRLLLVLEGKRGGGGVVGKKMVYKEKEFVEKVASLWIGDFEVTSQFLWNGGSQVTTQLKFEIR